ncbi:acetyl-CoA C-acetyltransferase [Microbulbifer pacificus]|uniref:acetyl-CoA C-acetyltransferase n=1 Tax=Microbulbifer pacificus TaxID=407164 RepID=UPI000CF558B3|nr:acetyl-CoA C-acetyltransferase [Microbulbifer pacificus]
MPHPAYIYDAIRTPRGKGKVDGSLHQVQPAVLGGGLLGALQRRHDLDTSQVDDVIMGCVSPVGEQGGDIAKSIVQYAGWAECVPGVQLDRFCASGLEAVNMAAMKVASGWEQLVVAGGVESMSRVPMGSSWKHDPNLALRYSLVPQGVAADAIATMGGWTREDVDAYAVESQRRASTARSQGFFDKSIAPVVDADGAILLAQDEIIKPDTTLNILGNLRPAFADLGISAYDEILLGKYPELDEIQHVHTAGNSSGIVDGAAAVLIGSEQAGRKLGLAPRARIVSTAVLANDPSLMLIGAGPAAQKALQRAGLSVEDIDLFEMNEAFSAVVLRFMRDLGISHDVTNVNGGAIAMGHPLGATGAMLVGTMTDELERRQLRRGLIALCVGGGQGIAAIIERV